MIGVTDAPETPVIEAMMHNSLINANLADKAR